MRKFVGFAVFALLMTPVTAWACTITCADGSSCSAEGTGASCSCHWWTGSAQCEDGQTIQQNKASGVTYFDSTQAELTFAELGGDPELLLTKDLSPLFETIIGEFGFNENTRRLIDNLSELQRAFLANDSKAYYLAAEDLDHFTIRRFKPADREFLAQLMVFHSKHDLTPNKPTAGGMQ